MYITTGSIEHLVGWFRDDIYSRYLLLFVAGDVSGRQFFSSLYDHKETIDFISGKEIAVFLFIGSDDSALELPSSEGTRLFLPGQRLDTPTQAKYQHRNPDLYRYDLQATNIHISEIDSTNIKDKLVNSSITFSHEIAEYFDLNVNDVPAIVLLYKSYPDPLIIKTRGQADAETVVKFLKDVRGLEIPHVDYPRKEKKNAKARLRDARLHLDRATRRLDLAIEKWKTHLEDRDVPRDILDQILTRDVAGEVWVISGMNGSKNIPSLAHSYSEVFEIAISKDEFRESCRLVKKKFDLHRSHQVTVQKMDNLVQDYEELAIGLEQKLIRLESLHDDIERLGKKYERSFHLKDAFDRIVGFINAVTGISKRAKELTDAQKNIMNLLGE